MRSTQYIGLNKYGKDWLESQDTMATFDKRLCDGLGEPVNGHIYHIKAEGRNNVMYIAEEVVSDVRWSSGPVILSHLQVELVKLRGDKILMGDWFKWMLDPSVTGVKVDFETGRYYI